MQVEFFYKYSHWRKLFKAKNSHLFMPDIKGYIITYTPRKGSYGLPDSLKRGLENIHELIIREERIDGKDEIGITLPEDLEERVSGIRGVVKIRKCPEYDLQLI